METSSEEEQEQMSEDSNGNEEKRMERIYIQPFLDSPTLQSYTLDQDDETMSNNSTKEEEKEDERGLQIRKKIKGEGNNTGKKSGKSHTRKQL